MPAWSGSGEASLPRCRWPPRPCMYPSMVGESQPAPGGRFYEGTNPITRAPTYPSLLTPSPCGVRSQHVNLGDTHIQTTAAAVVPREYVYLHQKASQCTSETREFGLVLDLDTTVLFFFLNPLRSGYLGVFCPQVAPVIPVWDQSCGTSESLITPAAILGGQMPASRPHAIR